MHIARRKVADRGDADELLDAWESSRLEFKAFCAARGVDGRSLQCWRTNLRRREAVDSPIRLVELTTRAPARATYRVVVGDVAIELDDAFREDTLARLIGVVTRC